jgi:hypothetical protein
MQLLRMLVCAPDCSVVTSIDFLSGMSCRWLHEGCIPVASMHALLLKHYLSATRETSALLLAALRGHCSNADDVVMDIVKQMQEACNRPGSLIMGTPHLM